MIGTSPMMYAPLYFSRSVDRHGSHERVDTTQEHDASQRVEDIHTGHCISCWLFDLLLSHYATEIHNRESHFITMHNAVAARKRTLRLPYSLPIDGFLLASLSLICKSIIRVVHSVRSLNLLAPFPFFPITFSLACLSLFYKEEQITLNHLERRKNIFLINRICDIVFFFFNWLFLSILQYTIPYRE